LQSGKVFGSWTLQQKLGEGGNGVVWSATGTNGLHGAIKFIKSHHLQLDVRGLRSIRLQRFYDEIFFLKRYAGSSGIMPLIDSYCPELPSELDRPWFVTPLGVELRAAIGDLDVKLDFAVKSIASVARTVAALHAVGVFHRDIKPDNIIVLDSGPVISDFGLVDFPDKTLVTGSEEFLGPLFYLAPEMMADTISADSGKADVYSLAKTLWVVATAQKFPLPGEQRVDVPALTLSAYVKDNRCASLDRLLEAATRQEPSARPTMKTFANELEAWGYPPSKNASTSDQLLNISAVYRPILQGFEDAQKSQVRRINELKSLAQIIRARMDLLYKDIVAMNLQNPEGSIVAPQIASAGDLQFWYDWPNAPRPITKLPHGSEGVFIVQHLPALHGRTVVYCGGFRLSPSENNQILVTAAHAFGSANSDAHTYNECIWKQEIQVYSGMPSAIQIIDKILDEFATELPTALSGMIDLVSKIGNLRPN
jgi:serine/threonine protein kinase